MGESGRDSEREIEEGRGMQEPSWQSRYGDMAFNNQRIVVMNRLTSSAARKLGVRVVDAYAPSAAWFPNEVGVA